MDSLDVRIYREFFHGKTGPPLESDMRRSYRSMARTLRIDEVTIQNRIKKLQQSGFLKGWRLVVNPVLLGMKWAQLWFDVRPPSDKDDVIRKISLMNGVLTISDYFGSGLTVIIMYNNEISAQKEFELVEQIANAESITRTNIPFPQCQIKLTQTDWRIVKAIQVNPRQTDPLISQKVGISSKTVKRRLQRMILENALFVLSSFNPKGLDGAILTDLVVFYANPKSRTMINNRIVSQFSKLLIRAELDDVEHGFFNLIIRNISEAREIQNWVKEQPDVRNAFVYLVTDRIEIYESLSELVDKKLAEELALKARLYV